MRESIISKKTFADLVSVFFVSKRGGACMVVGKAWHKNNRRILQQVLGECLIKGNGTEI